MNDTAQATQNAQPQVQQRVGISPVQPSPQGVSVGGSKESAPIPTNSPSAELVKENLPIIELSQEVKEAGVKEVKRETLEVSPDMQQAGVQPVGLAAAVPAEPTLKFPITEEKAQGILKMHKKVKESVTWLAMLVVRQIQILRLKQKEEK